MNIVECFVEINLIRPCPTKSTMLLVNGTVTVTFTIIVLITLNQIVCLIKCTSAVLSIGRCKSRFDSNFIDGLNLNIEVSQ